MSLKDLALNSFYSRRVPLFWGAPGVGKTNWLLALAAELKLRPFLICLSHRADNEVHGQPVIARGTIRLDGRDYTVVEQAPPSYVIEAIKAKDADYHGAMIVFDEITTTQPSTAGPALAIFDTPHRIGGIELPDNVCVAGAANPSNWAAGGWDLSLPSVRRFDHYKFIPSATEWADNFPSYWGRPPRLGRWGFELTEEDWAPHRAMVASFVRTSPEVIYQLPKDNAQRTGCWTDGDSFQVGGFSCPATLDAVSRHLAIAEKLGTGDDVLQDSLVGAVGVGVAMHFLTFRENLDMPKPRDILDHPERVSDVPVNRSDRLFYIVQSCVELVRYGKKQADASPKSAKIKEQSARDWVACWEVVARVAIGPLRGQPYDRVLKGVIAQQQTMSGAMDIAAAGARYLADRQESQPGDATVREACTRNLREIDLFPMITRAAGVNWLKNNQNTGQKA